MKLQYDMQHLPTVHTAHHTNWSTHHNKVSNELKRTASNAAVLDDLQADTTTFNQQAA